MLIVKAPIPGCFVEAEGVRAPSWWAPGFLCVSFCPQSKTQVMKGFRV